MWRRGNGKFIKKTIVMFCIFAVITLGIILALYRVNSLIPDGILVAGVDTDTIQKNYKELYADVEPYGIEEAYGIQGAVLITAKPGKEQLLSYTLQEKNQESYVRNLSVERRLRLVALEILGCIVLCQFFIGLYSRFVPDKWKRGTYILHILTFFLVCALVSDRDILPTECIPEKFIYVGEWWEKSKAYFEHLKALGKIPCADYQQFAGVQGILLVLLAISLSVFNVLKRKIGSSRKKA